MWIEFHIGFFCFDADHQKNCTFIDVSSKGQFYLPPEKTETAD